MVNHNTNETPPKTAPKHLVVVQLTRAGDLIQTLQAVKDVRQERPELKLTLVARKHFADQVSFLLNKVFDQVVVIDTPKLFSENLAKSREYLNDAISRIQKWPVEAIVNLSLCKPSQYLCGLVKANHRLGPWLNEFNQEVVTDRWSQLSYTTVTQGSLNPFHLVDLFKFILGVKPKKIETKTASSNRKNWIVVHPFASTERKRWKMHKWSEILFKIAKDHPGHSIFVVGAPNEASMASQLFEGSLIKSQKSIINLVGQTSLSDVYDRLSSSKLFIGHDSLIGHLASVANTKSLTLSLGSVRPWETAPYGASNIVLAPRTKCFPCFPQDKCSQYICHADIPYQLVTDLSKILLSDNHLDQLSKYANPFLTGTCHIFTTEFNRQSGLMDFVELDPKPSSLSEVMRTAYRMTWAYTLSEIDEHRGFPVLSREAHAQLLEVFEGLGYLFELAEFGKKYSMSIVEEVAKSSPSLTKIKATSQKIDEIDRLANLVKRSHPSLSPVVDYFAVARANLPGSNIVEMAQQSYFVYHDTSLSISIINELIQKTIAEHKHQQQRLNQTSPTAR